MRIKLPINTWTQINTDSQTYLMQNISKYNVLIKVASSAPGEGESYDFDIAPGEGLGNENLIGLLWGRPKGSSEIQVGLVEG